jgi:hypothetical protein
MPNDGGSENKPWQSYSLSVKELQNRLKSSGMTYNFFSNIREDIRSKLEAKGTVTALLAEPSSPNTIPVLSFFNYISVGQNSIPTEHRQPLSGNTLSFFQVSPDQLGKFQITAVEKALAERRITQIDPLHIGFGEISLSDGRMYHSGVAQISSSEISPNQYGVIHTSSEQSGFGQIRTTKINHFQISSTQIDPAQINVNQQRSITYALNQLDSHEITFSSSVSLQQLFSGNIPNHNETSNQLAKLSSTLPLYWNMGRDFKLNFNITDLPTGQLAEATITSYNAQGQSNAATIDIDINGNGQGWFLDSTPEDSSEFSNIGGYLQANPNSAAYGKYDLLTTILHEMGHALGIIGGYSAFDQNVRNNRFIATGVEAQLTADGSHLENSAHPHDLMNTSLRLGVRKLPSQMDWAILDAINNSLNSGNNTASSANLSAGGLLANGDFTNDSDWQQTGAIQILNGTATLSEQSQKLAELTQAFIIPTGATRLQFTIENNHLIAGDSSRAANDAFEVALLNTQMQSLAGTTGLSHTDSFLNLQANGTIHKSDRVTNQSNNRQIVSIDLTGITSGTEANLYFNLLGFGDRSSTITIDDVKLFTDADPAPIATNDQITTNHVKNNISNILSRLGLRDRTQLVIRALQIQDRLDR